MAGPTVKLSSYICNPDRKLRRRPAYPPSQVVALAAEGLRRHPHVRGGAALSRLPFLFACLAAIMLVISGTPARAAVTPCDPCPPDCPMMAQMHAAQAAADHHAAAPENGGKAGNPCKPGLACQMGASAPILSETSAPILLTTDDAHLSAVHRDGGPSRPPDPRLRPPIEL